VPGDYSASDAAKHHETMREAHLFFAPHEHDAALRSADLQIASRYCEFRHHTLHLIKLCLKGCRTFMNVPKWRNIRRTGLIALVALAVGCNSATAGTNTGTLTVTASVAAVCIIGNATLAFGAYNPTSGTATTANATTTLTCTLGTPYNIGMSPGAGTGATVTLRIMTSGTNTLGYKLFQNAALTTNWGNTVGTDTYSNTSSTSSLTQTITIYGQIPASEAAAVGSYTDTVTMTVTF